MVRKVGALVVSLACFGGGGIAAVLVYPAMALGLYVVLVVVAIVTDTPAGGPLALPFLLVVATAAGMGYTLLALLAVGVSARFGSRSRRRVLMFVVVSILLWVVTVVTATMVLAVREPGMATSEALAWSAGIAAGGVPAWLMIATVWFGLRAVHGAVRWVENASFRPDRALAGA